MRESPVNPIFCVLIRKGRKTQTNEIFQEVESYDAYQNLILQKKYILKQVVSYRAY